MTTACTCGSLRITATSGVVWREGKLRWCIDRTFALMSQTYFKAQRLAVAKFRTRFLPQYPAPMTATFSTSSLMGHRIPQDLFKLGGQNAPIELPLGQATRVLSHAPAQDRVVR